MRVNFTINSVIVTISSSSGSGVDRITSSIPARRQLRRPRFFFLFSGNSWTVKSATVGVVVLVTSTGRRRRRRLL